MYSIGPEARTIKNPQIIGVKITIGLLVCDMAENEKDHLNLTEDGPADHHV